MNPYSRYERDVRCERNLDVAAGEEPERPPRERVLVGVRTKHRREGRQQRRLIAPPLQRALLHKSNTLDHSDVHAAGLDRQFASDSGEDDVAMTALLLTANAGYAQTATCKAQASEKHLAGAALSSFMKKCQTDAQKACDTSAADKKLAGAAKNSFTKKCVTDAVGT